MILSIISLGLQVNYAVNIKNLYTKMFNRYLKDGKLNFETTKKYEKKIRKTLLSSELQIRK